MTPRRPSPARPGARPGARPRKAAASSATSGPAVQPRRATADNRPATGTRPAPEHAVLRLGGADGLPVPLRALALGVVLLLAFVVTFPSLRGYLAQQAQYDALTERIAQAKATSTALEQELQQWQDEDYVKAQARERLSYVMPGETTYVVVGADKLTSTTSAAATTSDGTTHLPWYETLRQSARVAGAVDTGALEPAQQGWSTTTPTTGDTATTGATATSTTTP